MSRTHPIFSDGPHVMAMIILTIIISSMTISLFSFALAEENVFPPGSKPYGQSYGEWSIKWWQWALSIPTDRNPINDDNGKYCATSQNDPNVWFLSGSGGGKVVRDCAIPSGKAIFFPILDVECSYAESPTDKTEADLRKCAHADQDTVSHLTLKIDGIDVQNLTGYRVDSTLFNFTTPQNGLFDLHSATTQAVSDGFFFMVKPLSIGSHEIHFSGILGGFASTSPQIQPEDTTYHLKVG
jgi:hypothetical protein